MHSTGGSCPRTNRVFTTITYGAIVAAAVVTFVRPNGLSIKPATALTPPDVIYVTGTARDFRQSHPDFDVLPAAGDGHSAGNVKTTLGTDGRPVFVGQGINSGSGETPEIDLIAHWPFEEAAGSTAGDSVGANDGTLLGGASWTTGQLGGALQFDGTDDHVNIPNSPEMQVTGDITFAGWFKLDSSHTASSADTQVIMEKFLDVDHDFHIAMAGLDYNRPEVPKGSLVFKVENGPTSDYYCYVWTNRTSWNAGEWYHFAASLKSGDTSQNRIFINGADDTSSVIAAGVGFLDTDYDAPMRIGGKTIDYNGFATDIYFDGAIDEVMIFARTVNESDFIQPGDGGYLVDIEWTDDSGRNIAPHTFRDGIQPPGMAFVVAESITLSNTAIVDAYIADAGPYGAGNQHLDATLTTNGTSADIFHLEDTAILYGDGRAGPGATATAFTTANSSSITGSTGALGAAVAMPSVSAPTGLGSSTGPMSISADTTITTDLHVDAFTVFNGATATIDGNVVILAEGAITVENSSAIELTPGSTLELYGKQAITFENIAMVNANTGDPSLVRVFGLGSNPVVIKNTAELYGIVQAPNSVLEIGNNSDLFGGFAARGLVVNNTGEAHLAHYAPVDACGNTLGDLAGSAGVADTGAITSAATFAQWFRDVLGTNFSAPYNIPLANIGGGVYEYNAPDFHPLDGQLLGNEGDAHNYYLTFAFANRFTYDECQQQFFDFEGADDAWLFIDGELVMDVGGIRPGVGQYVDLDRLGLADGESHTVHFFYAQRQSFDAGFRLRTNVTLESNGPAVASGGWD